jgi:hypothetical protein
MSTTTHGIETVTPFFCEGYRRHQAASFSLEEGFSGFGLFLGSPSE